MKVIQELVAYFDRKGMLNKAQMKKLMGNGYLANDAPENMVGLCERPGQTYYFRVVGQTNGPLWGTDLYTADSSLGTAAVHAGLVKVGATAAIKVTVAQDPREFVGSRRNGISSEGYGPYQGSFQLAKV